MKIERVVRRGLNEEKGAILLIVIVFMMALTIVGLALLHATVMEHNLAMREVHKNQAFYLADGGIEHLRFKLYSFGGQQAIKEMDPVSGGYDGEYWPAIGVTSSGKGDYWVEYYEGSSGYAISTGRITKGDREILRRIKIRIYDSGLFDYGVFADKGMRMTGHAGEYKVSGWHSDPVNDPDYDPSNPPTADIGTNGTQTAALDLQNSQVDGYAFAGPYTPDAPALDDVISLHPQGSVGGKDWAKDKRPMPSVAFPNPTIDMDPLSIQGGFEEISDYISSTMHFPSITVQGITEEQAANGGSSYQLGTAPLAPESETIWIEERDPSQNVVFTSQPTPMVVGPGEDYEINYASGEVILLNDINAYLLEIDPTYVPTEGATYYLVSAIKGSLIIDQDCTMIVDTLEVKGGGSIVVNTGVSLTLYITEEMSAMGGGIVNDSQIPSQLVIYGGPDCTTIEIGGTPDFYGVVYAPSALINANGTGDIYGSLVGDFVRVVGTPHIYWDAALKDDPSIPVVTTLGNWEEIS